MHGFALSLSLHTSLADLELIKPIASMDFDLSSDLSYSFALNLVSVIECCNYLDPLYLGPESKRNWKSFKNPCP